MLICIHLLIQNNLLYWLANNDAEPGAGIATVLLNS
jgi:hypothetical protein